MTLIELRDAIALQGRSDALHLAQQFSTSRVLVEAMLQRLTLMGTIEAVPDETTSGCQPQGCKGCPSAKGCSITQYQIKKPD